MKYTLSGILACGLFLFGAYAQAGEILRAESIVEATTEGSPAPVTERDEFADQARATLTREVRVSTVYDIEVVELLQPVNGDGYGELSVDLATELGREIVRWCPSGSTCQITGILINGTLTRLYSIKKVK